MAKLSARGRYTVAEATKTSDTGMQYIARLMSDNVVLLKVKYPHSTIIPTWKRSHKTRLDAQEWHESHNGKDGWTSKLVNKY